MVDTNKKKFIEIFKSNIHRDGADELLAWLESSDFFTAPASTKFHSAVEGGLCDHSIKAYFRLIKNLQMEYGDSWQEKYSPETVAICGLLHDVCKVNIYKVDYRNVKVDGEWVKQPYYVLEDSLPYGHGEKSVYIISGFMRLTREEAMTINWHMGGFDMRVKGGSYSISDAFYRFPLACIFHMADMQSTYLDEDR